MPRPYRLIAATYLHPWRGVCVSSAWCFLTASSPDAKLAGLGLGFVLGRCGLLSPFATAPWRAGPAPLPLLSPFSAHRLRLRQVRVALSLPEEAGEGCAGGAGDRGRSGGDPDPRSWVTGGGLPAPACLPGSLAPATLLSGDGSFRPPQGPWQPPRSRRGDSRSVCGAVLGACGRGPFLLGSARGGGQRHA